VYDLTFRFCERFLKRGDRTIDQMVQAARSGKQNIAEGSVASGASKEMEIKLTNVARASLEELLVDYQDFLRVRGLPIWPKDSREAQYVRQLGRKTPITYETYRAICESRPAEIVANIAPLSDSSDQLFARSTDSAAGTGFYPGRRLARAHDARAVATPESKEEIGLMGLMGTSHQSHSRPIPK
jgi:hypothetical protein